MTIVLQNIMQRLPHDIINIVFGKMSYKPQLKVLMEDIRNFSSSKKILEEMYNAQFNKPNIGAHADAPESWLENDLWGWANDNHPLMHQFDNKMYNLWERMLYYWTDTMKAAQYGVFGQQVPPPIRRPLSHYKIDCYLTNYLEMKNTRDIIRLFLGRNETCGTQ